MDHVLGDEGVVGLRGVVVYHRCVGSSSAYRLKAGSSVQLLLLSALVHIESGIVLVHFVEFRPPGPEVGHSHTVDDVAPDKSVDFFLRPDCPVQSDSLPLDRALVLDGVVDIVVDG